MINMNGIYVKYKDREWVYQIAILIIAAIFWHIIYTGLIRPVAHTSLEQQAMQSQSTQQADEMSQPSFAESLAIIIKDYEQEACFIAAFWAFFIMLFKLEEIKDTRRLFRTAGRHGQDNFLETQEGGVILPEAKDMQKYRSIFERLEGQGKHNNALFRVVSACLNRFFATSKVIDATSAMEQACEIESERLDVGLSIVRYLVWVIPSIGFIGTVRGISLALGKAEEAIQGNIAPVTENLGTAFNSTLVALVISVIIVFLMYKLQEAQETLMLDVQRFCEKNALCYLQEKP